MQGKTLAEIAELLGFSGPSGVSYALKQARKELREAAPVEDLEMLRSIHFMRYEEMLSRWYPLALGGVRDGERIPPDRRAARMVLQILADERELMGLDVDVDEVMASASPDVGPPYGEGDGAPILEVEFDRERWEAELRRRAAGVSDDLVAVDHQPPSGYIAPRPGEVDDESEEITFEPNSVDPVTGEPIWDIRAAIKRRD
jgi:hypothetical protein